MRAFGAYSRLFMLIQAYSGLFRLKLGFHDRLPNIENKHSRKQTTMCRNDLYVSIVSTNASMDCIEKALRPMPPILKGNRGTYMKNVVFGWILDKTTF